ncbi:site-specific integrase [Ignatzschineria rhizosphaerae]|uniref:Site-specific integrase n=1 Tax=Ignatzschineria rhizosphaerae TaxID=2923279 RepID=A0ABY3XAX9_9GAMM|nr:site-specific integrase [Ignatzschineria rhizosphaerae]UNM97113.1 site-specific integrase [Ignatzschineria rhizosphaerae]
MPKLQGDFFLNSAIALDLTQDQRDFLILSAIPTNLKLISRDFDSEYVETNVDVWRIKYSGRSYLFKFDLKDTYKNKFLKWVTSSILKVHSISYGYACYLALTKFLLSDSTQISFSSTLCYLQSETVLENTKIYYPLKRVISFLIESEFPEFPLEALFELESIPKPKLKDWEYYYQFDIKIKPDLKRFIRNAILNLVQDLSKLSYEEIIYLSTLVVCYESGLRPFQLFNLKMQDFKKHNMFFELDVSSQKISSKRKKKQVVSLSSEAGKILEELVNRRLLIPFETDQLLQISPLTPMIQTDSHYYLNSALKLIQKKCNSQNSDDHLPIISAYDFRHNVGHSLAMSGASADEIAYMLGHNSTVVARHYISATPEIAILKQKALGENNAYLDMMGLIMTGDITTEDKWTTEKVSGSIALSLVTGIGGCGAESCHFIPVRACYGCSNFYPFRDADHNHVKNLLKEEVKLLMDLSDNTGQASRNPIINEYEQTIFEVDSVITRCQKQGRGK